MNGTNESGAAPKRGGGLASPRFAAVMASQALSLLGMEILQFVLPLHLLNLTGSGALYGGVVAAGFVPYTLLAPIGGVIADRTRKRGVMIAVDAVLAMAMAAYLFAAGTSAVIAATVAVLMLAFAAQALCQPCVQSAIPHLVESHEVERAVALVNQVGMLTGIGGPVAGGVAFGFLGLAPIVFISAACFAASALVVAALVHVPYEPPARTAGAVATACADLKEALAFLRSRPLMWRTIMAATPGTLGIRRVPALLLGVVAGIAAIACVLMVPLPALGTYTALVVLYLPTMAVCMCMSIVATSYLQVESPGTLVGKVMALAIMLANCATPAGQLAYGVALDIVPAWAIALVAASMTAAVAWWLARAER